ncbi:nucleoside diphosphate kinase regulator [Alsobacter sp. SYSU M60028]|uniref:Nucleoside diphosphate kinase regulator n=1 Tax=Alsobacter ponti TaxID=2962936 RepID=A0ABT1LGY3_9HYPH|nr:nucleoside diphosphate kinase regulator [Alsobacter ponti]MCP8940770.1 nucleoside diphosphate kinase regulator [Alsobacter ponti]
MKQRATSNRTSDQMPPILIEADHYRRLSALAAAASTTMPELSDYLSRELERASIVGPGSLPANVVRIGSCVQFRDESTGRVQDVVLVYPGDADIERKRISVLTPVGAALLGVAAGNSITFRTRSGETRNLTVLSSGRALMDA